MNTSEPPPNPANFSSSQQNIEGNQNQVIGQVLGGVVINQLTINDRVPATAVPSPLSVTLPLTQQEYRQRQVLLNKVKDYWVKGVLETSLHMRVLIELGLQERPNLVQRPFRDVAEFPESAEQSLPEGISVTTAFNQMGEGRTLLLLGEPGSGKTITLLKLAQDLIARTEQDLSQTIPVVFNLSSWAKKPQPIEQWLVQELLEKYQVSKALGKKWIETESLILLLDGLDEVKAEQRNACVQALNQFTQTHGTTELTICCRIRDYQALTERLTLRSAICIQPLTLQQIDQYFAQAGQQLSALRNALHQDQELQGLATSPLILSIMSLAYQDCAIADVVQDGTTADYQRHLFDTYIDRMFQRRGTTQQYPRRQAQSWLIWLAQHMIAAAQTVFLIERLQLNWLPTQHRYLRYRLENSLISGLFIGLVIGLIFVLGDQLSGALNDKFVAELLTKLSFGFIVGLVIALLGEFSGDIELIEIVRWSWRKATAGFLVGFIVGLASGLNQGLFVGLLCALYFGPVVGLIAGVGSSEIQQKEKPNQGIYRSARNAAILTIGAGLSYGLFVGLISGPGSGLYFGLTFGLIAGLIGGGLVCMRHFLLRLLLFRLGYSPWNYVRFLDYAVGRLFLQKVGGGYIFVHRMLLEHFAQMPLEQGRR
ncbi:MAG TPA: NACHT domain-containing protein [Trichocoleus sp.]|jgi:DNA polymerase III delta prime subunit